MADPPPRRLKLRSPAIQLCRHRLDYHRQSVLYKTCDLCSPLLLAHPHTFLDMVVGVWMVHRISLWSPMWRVFSRWDHSQVRADQASGEQWVAVVVVFMSSTPWRDSRSGALLPARQMREGLATETLHAFRGILASAAAHDDSSRLTSACGRLMSVSRSRSRPLLTR